MKINGTLKTAGIVLGIILTVGGVIWALATQSGNLDEVIEDVAKHEVKYDKVEIRVNTVEKAIIKIETNMEHMMTMQGQILDELRK